MTRPTFGLAAALLALSASAFAQTPSDLSPGLPDTQSAPGPHSGVATLYGDNNNAKNGNSSLPDAVGASDGTGPAASQYNRAVGEYKSGKLGDAVKDLQAVLKQEPGDAQARKLLAYTLLRQNKSADALPYLEATVKAAPQDVQTRDNLGKVYLALKRPAEAAAQFNAVLAVSPKDATAARMLAQIAVKTTTAATTETVTTKPSQKPEQSDLTAKDYATQGADLLKANKFDAAMAAYGKAADLDPKNADLRLYIGELYMRAGVPGKAIPAIDQALAMHTKHIFEASTMLGQIYAPTDPAKAISEFKLATDARPSDPAAWYNLGVLEAQAGDTADARQHYQKALSLNPADPVLADHAKQSLAALGK